MIDDKKNDVEKQVPADVKTGAKPGDDTNADVKTNKKRLPNWILILVGIVILAILLAFLMISYLNKEISSVKTDLGEVNSRIGYLSNNDEQTIIEKLKQVRVNQNVISEKQNVISEKVIKNSTAISGLSNSVSENSTAISDLNGEVKEYSTVIDQLVTEECTQTFRLNDTELCKGSWKSANVDSL